ncbi:hypothetical protein HBI32_237350 [Parastagonospora nodorum]|nr:hypothetical protein HBI32_237350 [Parastagonospora nodorum]
MAFFSLIVLPATTLVVHAVPVELDQVESTHSQGWNKEAIFTLVGVFLALVAIVVMVILALPSVRRWFTSTRSDTELASMEGAAWEEYMEAKKKTLMLRKKWEESIRPRHA